MAICVSSAIHLYFPDSCMLIDTCLIDQPLNMLCCWIEDPNSDYFKNHLPRIGEYLWVGEDGMMVQVRVISSCINYIISTHTFSIFFRLYFKILQKKNCTLADIIVGILNLLINIPTIGMHTIIPNDRDQGKQDSVDQSVRNGVKNLNLDKQ